MGRSYVIELPRNEEVDVFNIPENFDDVIRRIFAEYTDGTCAAYRDVDRLGFMDCVVRHLNGDKEEDDLVDARVKDMMAHAWDYDGEMLDEDDIFCREFMYDCCRMGQESCEIGGRYGIDDHHIYDEVHKVVARIMRVVSTVTEEEIREIWGRK